MQSPVHVRSSASVRIISLDVDTVIARPVKQARKAMELNDRVLSVWLFGSLARREALPGSDADVLIVLERSKVEFRQRIEKFSDAFTDVGVPVDVLPVTVAELETKKNDPFWARILTKRQQLA